MDAGVSMDLALRIDLASYKSADREQVYVSVRQLIPRCVTIIFFVYMAWDGLHGRGNLDLYRQQKIGESRVINEPVRLY